MTKKHPTDPKVRLYPPPPKDFDPFAATDKALMKHGLPLRPDPQTQPGLAALWERQADRYRHFEHLTPRPDSSTAATKVAPVSAALGPDATVSCGYQLFSTSAPFTVLFVTWIVPNLHFTPNSFGDNHFHTFVGRGFLDVHVEMTVDSAQNVTSHLWAQNVGTINLPVRPGDVISASLCLQTNQAGTAAYFLANETTSQTVNFVFDTGFPPAVTINAGVTRSGPPNQPFPPLASFGVVYFDEISAYTTSGPRSLTSGQAITMVDRNGRTLARPVRISDFAFKTVFIRA